LKLPDIWKVHIIAIYTRKGVQYRAKYIEYNISNDKVLSHQQLGQ